MAEEWTVQAINQTVHTTTGDRPLQMSLSSSFNSRQQNDFSLSKNILKPENVLKTSFFLKII